ncbi:MAG: hypothetical protein V9E96_10500 [Chitinophagaceae bacterium]
MSRLDQTVVSVGNRPERSTTAVEGDVQHLRGDKRDRADEEQSPGRAGAPANEDGDNDGDEDHQRVVDAEKDGIHEG